MKVAPSVAKKAAFALALADIVLADPIATLSPCTAAASLGLPDITVTAQYQPVATCVPSTACVKGQCSTIYPLTTVPFVSTVIPYAWNGTTTQSTTVTDVTQAVVVSQALETSATVTAAAALDKRSWIDWFNGQKSKSITLYETVTRRAIAPYNALGGIAVPGWGGSGLCAKCDDDQGGRSQLIDVIECRSGTDAWGKSYEKCVEWYETLIERPAPTSTVTAQAKCASSGKIPHAGTYTWTFPQTAPPVTITAPPVTVTVTVGGRPAISVKSKEIFVIPGQSWDACVTKVYSGATTFSFEVIITKIIIFNVPRMQQPAQKTRNIPIPSGGGHGGNGHGWWPLPNDDDNGHPHYGGSNPWSDWNGNGNGPTGGHHHTTTTSAGNGVGPIGGTTSTSMSWSTTSGGNGVGPIGGGTSTSMSWSTSMSASTTSGGNGVGPIGGGTSTSMSASTTSGGNGVGPIGGGTSTSMSASTTSGGNGVGPIGGSTSASGSFSLSTATVSTTSAGNGVGPIGGSTTSLGGTSSSSFLTSTSTSAAPPAFTTTGAPICDINANICMNSNLITAGTVSTVDCPLPGLTCTVNQLLSLVPGLLNSQPSVLSVLVANNALVGLNISPQQVQLALDNGELNNACTALETVPVILFDPTCGPIGLPGASSSTSASSTAAVTTSAAAVTTTAAPVTTTAAPVTTTVAVVTTTAAAPATTTSAAVANLLCDVSLHLCTGQTLSDVGLQEVPCDSGIVGVVCSETQNLLAALESCVGNCETVGTSGTPGVSLIGLTGTETIPQIQGVIGAFPGCDNNGQLVTLSQPGCGNLPVVGGIPRKRTVRHRYHRA